jgi:hypothetical protein
MDARAVRIVGDVARRVAAMIDRKVRDAWAGCDFEQKKHAAAAVAAVASDALRLRADR